MTEPARVRTAEEVILTTLAENGDHNNFGWYDCGTDTNTLVDAILAALADAGWLLVKLQRVWIMHDDRPLPMPEVVQLYRIAAGVAEEARE